MVPYAINKDTITVFIDSAIHTVGSTHPNFKKIQSALAKGGNNANDIRGFLKVSTLITKMTKGRTQILQNEDTGALVVRFDDREMKGSMASKIIELFSGGFAIDSWVNLMERIQANPDPGTRERIFDFLEVNKFPIAEDGSFITFKRVRSDYKDLYSGTFDNSVGRTVQVDRSQVDPDSSVTCSYGLHVAASHYLSHYAGAEGNRTMICLVDPRDICAIPNDYNNAKMRVCRYVVIGETAAERMSSIETETTVDHRKEMTFGVDEVRTASSGFTAPKDIVAKVKEMGVMQYAKSIGVAAHLIRNWLSENEPAVMSKAMVFKRRLDGKEFSGQEVLDGIAKEGTIASWARKNGLNSSTVGDWVKRIREMAGE